MEGRGFPRRGSGWWRTLPRTSPLRMSTRAAGVSTPQISFATTTSQQERGSLRPPRDADDTAIARHVWRWGYPQPTTTTRDAGRGLTHTEHTTGVPSAAVAATAAARPTPDEVRLAWRVGANCRERRAAAAQPAGEAVLAVTMVAEQQRGEKKIFKKGGGRAGRWRKRNGRGSSTGKERGRRKGPGAYDGVRARRACAQEIAQQRRDNDTRQKNADEGGRGGPAAAP